MLEIQNVPTVVSGVYFLWDNEELVYIGKSSCVLSRVGSHIQEKTKNFNRWSWIPAELSHLEYLENLYISKFSTKYNSERTRYVSIDFVSSLFNIRKCYLKPMLESANISRYGTMVSISEVADLLFDSIDEVIDKQYRTRTNNELITLEKAQFIISKCKEIREATV